MGRLALNSFNHVTKLCPGKCGESYCSPAGDELDISAQMTSHLVIGFEPISLTVQYMSFPLPNGTSHIEHS